MDRRRSRRTRRIVIGAIAALLLAAAVTVYVARNRRPFSEEELRAAEASTDALRARLRNLACHRPPMPGSIEASSPMRLGDLVDPTGPHGACLAAVAIGSPIETVAEREVRGPDGQLRSWEYDVPALESPPVIQGGLLGPEHPPYPAGEEPEEYAKVRAACPDLAAAVGRVAAGHRECSPFAVGTAGYSGFLDIQWELTQLPRAIRVLARGLARDGDLEGALTLLVHGVAVAQDLRRGGTSLIVAMQTVAMEDASWVTFSSLLLSHSAPDEPARARVAALLEALIANIPHPHDTLAAEVAALTAMPQPSLGSAERDALVVIAGESAGWVPRWCPRDGDPTDCFTGALSPGRTVDGRLQGVWELVGGPNAQMRSEIGVLVEGQAVSLRGHYARMLASLATIYVARVVLELAGARREGTCPADAEIAASLLAVPFATGPIEITHLGGPQYAVTTPPLALDPTFARTSLYFACPTVGGRWRDVE